MNNTDTYIINLKKDYGRYLNSLNTINIFGGKIITATDPNKCIDGYINQWKPPNIYTQSAKQTKRQILSDFLTNSSNQYITIFEDDIYIHNDLYSTKKGDIFNQLNNFISKKSPKLFYFGISRFFTSTNENTLDLKFTSFKTKFRENIKICSGAYGFMLHRDMIKYVLMRIDNTTFDENPFDLFCLSYISQKYPYDSYVVDPHIVVPDICHSNLRKNFNQNVLWSTLKTKNIYYYIPIIGIMYVNVLTQKSLNHFNKLITCMTPIISVYYYGQLESTKTLDDAKKANIYSSTDIKYHIFTNSDVFIKYMSGYKLFELIQNNKNIIIFSKDKEVFNIKCLTCDLEYEKINCDL